jgi:carboxyl-terminal processing protease
MYFLESDVREFQRYEARIDDLAKDGDFEFPQLVRKRYWERAKEAASYAEDFLSVKHDYSVDEECPIRFDAYANKPDQLRERWRLRIKAELLIEKLHGRQESDVKTQLSGRYQRIARQAREMTDERLCQMFLDSLAAIYEPHSGYISPTFLTSITQLVTFRTYNLGLILRQRAGQFVITSLHPSLRDTTTENELVGWSLIAIRRLNGTTLDLVEMHPDDLHQMIRSPSGSLESDTEIILELQNPVTYERVTMSWNRFPSY